MFFVKNDENEVSRELKEECVCVCVCDMLSGPPTAGIVEVANSWNISLASVST